MRTEDEIVERIRELRESDVFGFTISELVAYLPFERAREFLEKGATGEDWPNFPTDRDSVVKQMRDYMAFAWEKANNRRGISAWRSLAHMQAWLWMIGEESAAEALSDYDHYGKPQLRAICDHFGWDWRDWDDDSWANAETEEGAPADRIETVDLGWAAA